MTQPNVIIWIVGIVAWCVIRYPYQRRARKYRVATHHRGVEERLLLAGSAVGLVLVPVVWIASGWPSAWDYEPSAWQTLLGAVCMVAFLGLFHAVHRQLGRNWSITLEIREEHALVTDGLFRHVRHPMYSSFWLWALAQALLIPNGLAGLAGLASIAALYFGRVHREERMLRETFGPQYDAYMLRTKRIIPWLW